MIKRCATGKPRAVDIIDSHMKKLPVLYKVNKKPRIRNMTTALLREILDNNNVDSAQQKLCLAANEKSTSIRGRCASRQIYDLDAIEAMAEQDVIIEYDLSAILGRTITITRQQFLHQLEHLKKSLQLENYTMVVYPFSKLRMETPPPFNIIVQDDSLSAAWDAEKYTRRMYSEDLSIVNGFISTPNPSGSIYRPYPKRAEMVAKSTGPDFEFPNQFSSNGK